MKEKEKNSRSPSLGLRCSTKCHNGIAKMRFVISVLLFLVFILFGVPFVLYSTRQVLLIAPAQIKSDRTKYYLLASFVLHIKHSDSKDSAASPRILLSSPAGEQDHLLIHYDMTAHLSHYFVYTGHNLYLTGNQLRSDYSDIPIIQALQRGNSGQPPKRLEVSRSSNGEDDEEWSLISEMHSRLEISWRDTKYG
ncbi:hypothetical protein ACSBR2_025464 [Camellia fascicularis]